MARKVGFRKIFIDVPIAGTAVSISSYPLFVTEFEVYVPTGNTGSVYIGNKDVENSSGADGGWIPRTKGEVLAFTASENVSLSSGDFFDLSSIYIDADNAGDDVIVQYKIAEA